MINCQAIALNQERKPRTNEREPHVAPRHYGRNLANTYVHSRVCYVNWVSSTGSAVRVSSQASHSPRLSRLPISKQRGERSVRETSVPQGDHA